LTPITKAILIANVVVFVLQLIIGLPSQPESPPARLFYAVFMLNQVGLQNLFLWQPITHMFLHMGPLHILFNMLCLFFAGPMVERRVGPWHYLVIYFLGGIFGGLLQILVANGNLLGASGGVFAVILAFTALEPDRRILLLLFFIIPIPLRCRTLAIGLLSSSLVLLVLSMTVGMFPNLGHMAHLAGGITGWIYVYALRKLAHKSLRPSDEPWDGRDYDPVVATRRISGDPGSHSAERPQRINNQQAPRGFSDLFSGNAGGQSPQSRARERAQSSSAPRGANPYMGQNRGKPDAGEFERILDKVDREGLHSLTAEERRVLEKGSTGGGPFPFGR
jgi:membrane associated rhomboid family serine protease